MRVITFGMAERGRQDSSKDSSATDVRVDKFSWQAWMRDVNIFDQALDMK